MTNEEESGVTRKKPPIPAALLALVPATLLAAIVLSWAVFPSGSCDGALCGLSDLFYYFAPIVWVVTWIGFSLLIWGFRVLVAAGDRRRQRDRGQGAALGIVALLSIFGSVAVAAEPPFSEFCTNAKAARSSDKDLIEYLQRVLKANTCEVLGSKLAELTALNGFAEVNGELFPQKVSSLAILRYAPKLRVIDMPYGSPVADLRPLEGLTDLVRLRMSASKISDLGPLKGLTGLEELDVRTTRVKDLTPIMGLPNLKRVDLRNLKIPRAQIEASKPAIRARR